MTLPNYIPGDKADEYKDKVVSQHKNYVPVAPVKAVEKPAEKITAKKPKGE